MRFGRTIGEIRVEKGDFQGDFFENFQIFLGSQVVWAPEEYWAPDLIRVPKDHCTMFCCEQ